MPGCLAARGGRENEHICGTVVRGELIVGNAPDELHPSKSCFLRARCSRAFGGPPRLRGTLPGRSRTRPEHLEAFVADEASAAKVIGGELLAQCEPRSCSGAGGTGDLDSVGDHPCLLSVGFQFPELSDISATLR